MTDEEFDTWPIALIVENVRPITPEESAAEDWFHRGDCSVIEFTDGSKIFASCDPEGNGPGAIFGVLPDGTQVRV